MRVGIGLADLVDHMNDFGEAFEAEPLALEWDEDFIGSGEGGCHEHAKRRWCVEDAELEEVVWLEALEELAEAGEVVVAAGEFDFYASEVHFRGDDRKVFASAGDDLIADSGLAEQDRVETATFGCVDAEAAGAVRLRVEIDEQHALPAKRQCGGEVEGGGGFANSSLLVCDGNDFHDFTRSGGGRIDTLEWGACMQSKPLGVGKLSRTDSQFV